MGILSFLRERKYEATCGPGLSIPENPARWPKSPDIEGPSGPAQKRRRVQLRPERRARQIVRLRPFRSVDDLTRVDGIGPSRLSDIKDQGLAHVE